MIEFPDDDDAFRDHIRQWLPAHYEAFRQAWASRPSGGGERAVADPRDLDFRKAWEDDLCANGLSGLGWPRRYGGQELGLGKQAIFHEEHARCGAPLGVNLIGHGILAPTLLHFGTEAQKQRFLPGILSNRTVWCQGYSEPGSGSDLASLRTRAQREGDAYVLNGHKIWTSFADRADWCFVLARTDPHAARHRGISFLLVDMRQPGVRVAPIRQITGEAEFCEVFFENVRVPADCLVGAENQGWKIAMAAASYERGTYFIPRLVRFQQELAHVRNMVEQRSSSKPVSAVSGGQGIPRADGTESVAGAASLRQRWARLAIDSHVLQLKSRRALASAMSGNPPGPLGSSTKVHWSEAHQRLLDLALELLGDRICRPVSLQRDPEAVLFEHAYLSSKAETILAGTSEIQRNIIAEKVLGLPKGSVA